MKTPVSFHLNMKEAFRSPSERYLQNVPISTNMAKKMLNYGVQEQQILMELRQNMVNVDLHVQVTQILTNRRNTPDMENFVVLVVVVNVEKTTIGAGNNLGPGITALRMTPKRYMEGIANLHHAEREGRSISGAGLRKAIIQFNHSTPLGVTALHLRSTWLDNPGTLHSGLRQ